jgi:hypothetical protein
MGFAHKLRDLATINLWNAGLFRNHCGTAAAGGRPIRA